MDFEILDSLDISKNPEILQDSRDNRNSDIQIPEKANMKSRKKKFCNTSYARKNCQKRFC